MRLIMLVLVPLVAFRGSANGDQTTGSGSVEIRPDAVPGAAVRIQAEPSDVPGKYLVYAVGDNVSTNNLWPVADAIVDRWQLDISMEQQERAIDLYLDGNTQIMVATNDKAIRLDVRRLVTTLSAFDLINRARVIARQEIDAGEGVRRSTYFLTGSEILDDRNVSGRSYGNLIIINLGRIEEMARSYHEQHVLQDHIAQVSSREMLFSVTVSHMRHELTHAILEKAGALSQPQAELNVLLDQHHVPNALRRIVIAETAAHLVEIAGDRCPKNLTMVMYAYTSRMDRHYPELIPIGKLIVGEFLGGMDMAAYLAGQKIQEFGSRNASTPSVMDLAWLKTQAETEVRIQAFSRVEFVGFLKTLDDQAIRDWAKGLFEQHFGPMPDIQINLPQAVIDWLESEGETNVENGPGVGKSTARL